MEGPNFNWERRRPGKLGAPFERDVEIGGLDNGESTNVFLTLGKWAIRREKLPVLDPHDRGRAWRVKSAGEHPGASGFHLLTQRVDVFHDGLQDMRCRLLAAIGLIDAEQVLVHRVPPGVVVGVMPTSHSLHERLESKSTSHAMTAS